MSQIKSTQQQVALRQSKSTRHSLSKDVPIQDPNRSCYINQCQCFCYCYNNYYNQC